MPIEYSIDHARRLILAKGHGTFTDADIFGYQREVWSRPDVNGYDELIDMSEVKYIALESTGRMRQLAELSAKTDSRSRAAKFAIVAPDDIAFGLGRMYEAYRSVDVRSTKQVSVFRSMTEAFAFLGIKGDFPNKDTSGTQ
jgi:hypothetical protein